MIEVANEEQIERLNARVVELLREKEEALGYATRLLESFVAQHFPPNPDWKPLPDLLGVLTQLDNASTIAREYKAQLASTKQDLEQQRYENVKIYDCAKRHAAQLASARKALEEAEVHLKAMGSLKGWRLNAIRESLKTAQVSLSDEQSEK